MDILIFVLIHNILPIMFILGLGYILGKKLNLEVRTLSKINFYVYVPFFIFMQIYNTKMPVEMVKVLIFVVLLGIINSIAAKLTAKAMRCEEGLKNAFANSVMFYNSGNIGVPLITLAFSTGPFLINGETPYLALALTTQIVVLIFQNITTNTIGFFNAEKGKSHWKDSVKSILTMPAIYTIILAFILKGLPYDLTKFPLWSSFNYLKDGLISIALITLGVQLSKTKFSFKNKIVYVSNLLRLIGGPVLAFILIKLLDINGIPAQALMISSSIPTAVNTALIAVETDNHPDFASQAVMTSTLFSCITLAGVIYISRMLFPL